MKRQINSSRLRRAAIFIDASNYHYALLKQHWRIAWPRFITYFKQQYSEVTIFYYEGITSKAVYFDYHPDASLADFIKAKEKKKGFFKALKNRGMVVRTKLVQRVYDSTEGCYKHKCNFDVELAIDTIDHMDEYDDFILCSGDGDFVRLVKYVKGKFKKAIVIAPSKHFSAILWKSANQAICLEDLKDKIRVEK